MSGRRQHAWSASPQILAGLLAVGAAVLCGCGRPADPSSSAAPPEAAASPAPLPAEFRTGIIRARQWTGLPATAEEVTFWIGESRIRREVKAEGAVNLTGRDVAGIIVDLAADKVTLYAGKDATKHSTVMDLAAYRALCLSPTRLGFLDDTGVGTIFVLPPPRDYRAENTLEATNVDGYPCDLLVINQGTLRITIIEAEHTPRIIVDRELLSLVEVGLPDELTGFPLVVRRTDGVRLKTLRAPPESGRLKRFLAKGSDLLADAVDDLLKAGQEVTEVKAAAPEADWFSLSPEFSDIGSVDGFSKAFDPPTPESGGGHHHHHWDWD